MNNVELLLSVIGKITMEFLPVVLLLGCAYFGIRIQHWYDMKHKANSFTEFKRKYGSHQSLPSHSTSSYAPQQSHVRVIQTKPQVYDWDTDPEFRLVGRSTIGTNQPTERTR